MFEHNEKSSYNNMIRRINSVHCCPLLSLLTHREIEREYTSFDLTIAVPIISIFIYVLGTLHCALQLSSSSRDYTLCLWLCCALILFVSISLLRFLARSHNSKHLIYGRQICTHTVSFRFLLLHFNKNIIQLVHNALTHTYAHTQPTSCFYAMQYYNIY